MKSMPWIAAVALLSAACAEQATAPLDPTVSNTILVNGNDPTFTPCPPNPECLAPIDRAVQVLYNRNNSLSQPYTGTSPLNFHGEAEYRAASMANENLVNIWFAYEMEPATAISYLEAYISDVTRALSQNKYSACAAGQLLARANWLIDVINEAAANGFTPDMLDDAPPFDCALSPVIPSGSGNTAAGVSLTWQDPWGFQTYYEVQLPGGTVVTTTNASLVDASANVAGTFTYSVRQCAESLGCSVWTPVTVTVIQVDAPPPPGTCSAPHDNRNGGMVAPPPATRCEKEAKDQDGGVKAPVTNPGKN